MSYHKDSQIDEAKLAASRKACEARMGKKTKVYRSPDFWSNIGWNEQIEEIAKRSKDHYLGGKSFLLIGWVILISLLLATGFTVKKVVEYAPAGYQIVASGINNIDISSIEVKNIISMAWNKNSKKIEVQFKIDQIPSLGTTIIPYNFSLNGEEDTFTAAAKKLVADAYRTRNPSVMPPTILKNIEVFENGTVIGPKITSVVVPMTVIQFDSIICKNGNQKFCTEFEDVLPDIDVQRIEHQLAIEVAMVPCNPQVMRCTQISSAEYALELLQGLGGVLKSFLGYEKEVKFTPIKHSIATNSWDVQTSSSSLTGILSTVTTV